MANSSSEHITIYIYMLYAIYIYSIYIYAIYILYILLSCSHEDEFCDLRQIQITDLNNIYYNEHLFSINDCLYGNNYKLNVNNNYNNTVFL